MHTSTTRARSILLMVGLVEVCVCVCVCVYAYNCNYVGVYYLDVRHDLGQKK